MPKKDALLTRIKGSRPVRALGQRLVASLDARERQSDAAETWHRPSGAWALERVRLLELLPEREVASFTRIREYPRRSVARFDEDEARVWIILEGGVKLCRLSALGRRLIEALLERGDVFGRMSAGGDTAYEVEALERTRIASLDRSRFEALLRSHPDLAYAVVQELETRQRTLVRRIESLVFKDVHVRVAETLLELAKEQGEPCAHGFAVDVRVTQQDIAELVGASRQMVNRVLGDFSRRLYIQRMGRVLCVLHRERLERFVEGPAG
jgi:CRP-like cAMP-binding protein